MRSRSNSKNDTICRWLWTKFCPTAVVASFSLVLTAIGCNSVVPIDGFDAEPGGGRGFLDSDEVPLRFYQGLAVVEANIEGLNRPARLVIDSGAVSAIRRDIASHIAFSIDRSALGTPFEDSTGRAIDAEPVLLARVEVGRHVFEAVPAALVESEVFDRTCPPIDGLLGTGGLSKTSGFLDRVAVEIDRDAQRAKLSRDGSRLRQSGTTLPLRRYVVTEHGEKIDDSGTWVPIVIDGEFLWAQLDTGGAGLSTITLDVLTDVLSRPVEDLHLREYVGEDGVSVGGLGETNESWIARLPGVQIGKFFLGDFLFKVVRARGDGIPSVVLKQNLLKLFNFVLDYQQDEIRLDLAETRPSLDGMPLQLAWYVENGRTIIVGMLADGVATQQGIAVGDEVIAVGDHDIVPGNFDSMCSAAMSWRSSGEPLRLELRRGDSEFKVVLPSREN